MDGVNWKPGVILSNTRNQIDYIVNYLGDARRLTSQMQRGKNGSYLYYSLSRSTGVERVLAQEPPERMIQYKGWRAVEAVRFSLCSLLLLPPWDEIRLSTWKRKIK